MPDLDGIAFSFIVDADPRFAYQGWHLANSILDRLGANPAQIFVQHTSEVDRQHLNIFKSLGCSLVQIERFGDQAYCNKIAQWNLPLKESGADYFLFLDTDTIFVENCIKQIPLNSICGKVVDCANPPLEVFEEIMSTAGFSTLPPLVQVDAGDGATFRGNCNGGMYGVPRKAADVLFDAWRRWAFWLLDHAEPLHRSGMINHVDQVSFCMAANATGLPFFFVPSNLNYYVHFPGPHRHFDETSPISLLHYHNESLNVVGLLEPKGATTPIETAAVERANTQIAKHFNNKLFWDLRYAHFIERGSGVGSRGASLEYKRNLLRDHGVERASSVLDVGCGDLEVVKVLSLQRYVGIDQSSVTLDIAKRARSDWTFMRAPAPQAPTAEFVICFEVLIHQESVNDYASLIEYLSEKTDSVLIVSGYEEETDLIRGNAMLFYYEPLSESLKRTGKFRTVKVIGRHTDVTIFRCDVNPAFGAVSCFPAHNAEVKETLGEATGIIAPNTAAPLASRRERLVP